MIFNIINCLMKFEEVSWYSERLGRDMRIKIYGHYGSCFIAFPCQNKQSDDFSNHGMIIVVGFYDTDTCYFNSYIYYDNTIVVFIS